jgi:hypothetical protein
MIDCVNLKCCEDNFTKTMIPTITNSCVLLRPYHTQSQQQREKREEREEGGGVNEEIARPDGGLIVQEDQSHSHNQAMDH